jgi:hypothetical protein
MEPRNEKPERGACRYAAHWQRVWYMLAGLLCTSRSSGAASRRDRP